MEARGAGMGRALGVIRSEKFVIRSETNTVPILKPNST